MKCYLWSENTRVFIGTQDAAPGSTPDAFHFPLNACLDAVPENIPVGKIARRNEANTAWELVEAPTPAELRQAAYEAEADPLFREAQYYQAEAEGMRLLGDTAASATANEKADDLLKQYAAKKVEIRDRFPDPDHVDAMMESDDDSDGDTVTAAGVTAACEENTGTEGIIVGVNEPRVHREIDAEAGDESESAAGSDDENIGEVENEEYWLNATGTYHDIVCASVSVNGAALSLEEIALANPSARPCSRCNPPDLAETTV